MKDASILHDRDGCHGLARPVPEELPSIGLPICLRGLGLFFFRAPHREYVPAGKKNFVQLFWGVAGRGCVVSDGLEYELGPGDVFLRMPMEEHDLRNLREDWTYRWVAFDGPLADDFVRMYGFPRSTFRAEACPHDLFLSLEILLRRRSPFAWREAVGVIAGILARAGGRSDDSTREGRLVNQFIALCQEHFSDWKINVNLLADSMGISRFALTRLFREKMLMPPGKYLMQLRIQHALSLLQNTEKQVSEIARLSGFADFSHFCRVIRVATGLTPVQYRNHESPHPGTGRT
ncbi:MAG: Arabinose operon regulatory protein [Lentisphaerae bacterium ADurb.Bin242]|nr:MAG: Arabinose operon regulatory protein [Lentisphaerae bacterium ADurb.Bin242]